MNNRKVEVIVKTISRLHFGFIDLNGGLGRLYGSIGVALKNPRIMVTVTPNDKLVIENGDTEKTRQFVEKFSRRYQIEPAVRIRFTEIMPKHSGLGSGTQLALAVGWALARLYNIETHTRIISGLMNRGKRSGIGVACFENGGFVVDSGHKQVVPCSSRPPSVICRHNFPEQWCFVIVLPELPRGLFGESETNAMQAVISSKKISEEISRLTMMKLLPALIEEDIGTFGSALTAIDRGTGMYFEKSQGGIFRGQLADTIVKALLASGAFGAGQSSWGPALYGLVHQDNSQHILGKMKHFMAQNNIGGRVFISFCSNQGGSIQS